MHPAFRRLMVFLILCTAIGASAQQYFTPGQVVRTVKYRILPGKTADFYKSLAWFPKVMEAEKAAGIVERYTMYHSTEFVGPDRWDVMLVIVYKDMATLDTLGARTDPIAAKVYGSPEARAENGRLMSSSMEVVSSELIRQIVLK